MSEQKHYTPAPEDFRVGFECEILKWIDGVLIPEKWEPRIISAEGVSIQIEIAVNRAKKDAIRVPYLTAEQIEAEGWEKEQIGQHWLKNITGFKYILTAANTVTQEIETNCPHCWIIQRINPETWIIPNFQVFRGTIRCINDLRLICKLLGI